MNKPIMAKATAVWLVDNTTLSFKQIGDFCGLHELEVQGIADGDVAQGVKGFDPIVNNQLTQDEISKAEADPTYSLKLKFNAAAVGEEKRRGPRYTPLSKRQDRPASILWLVKFHPELTDGQISKNISNIQPIDPVALGLCRQSELDAAVQKANARKAKDGGVMTDDERMKLVSTETSLAMDTEPRLPSNIAGLEGFSLSRDDADDERPRRDLDANSLFNLPAHAADDEDEDEDDTPRRR